MIFVSLVLLCLAALPTVLTIVNLVALRTPPTRVAPDSRVAVLVPARDEADGIEACLASVLASTGVALEVIVGDDHSTDDTAAIVSRLAESEPRLRLYPMPPLPAGWTGKQHACHALAQLTDAPHLLFIDADVRLAPDAVEGLVAALAACDLVSCVPRQRMESLAELLAIPMINTLLLGYLPIPLARRDARASLAAGCGQMIAVRGAGYAAAGGHAAIRASMHDGLALPRRFRSAGLRTDLVLGAKLATCRMYDGWTAVVRGVTKNATEGMAQPIALPVWTMLLLGGYVLPWVQLSASLAERDAIAAGVAAVACAGPLLSRLMQAIRCREPLLTVPLLPFSVSLVLVLQWVALIRKWTGYSEGWRGRSYPMSG